MATRGQTYTGALSKPLESMRAAYRRSLGLGDDWGKEIRLLQSFRAAEEMRRMSLLCKHHGVAAGNWYALALALARLHVPGLKEAKGRSGAPRKWGGVESSKLVAEIDALKRERKLSVLAASKALVRKEPWKSLVTIRRRTGASANPAEAMRAQYHRTVKSEKRLLDTVRKKTTEVISQDKTT